MFNILKETMRRVQAEAIEKRLRENEMKGIKNPESVKQKEMKKKELEKRQEQANRSGVSKDNPLRVSIMLSRVYISCGR